MTVEQTALVNDIRKSFQDTIVNVKRALLGCQASRNKGYVFVWPEYWIGVKFNHDVCHGVPVHQATITHKADQRVFRNGNGQSAILMSREQALTNAWAHAVENLERFEASLAKAA